MKSIRRFIIILAWLLAMPFVASAQSDTIVSLITCAPGSDIYELEGHTALRIRSPRFDVAVSYGVFDFNSPNFVYRFVKGETDYMCAAIPWQIFVEGYKADGRRVVEQVLDLDSAQTRKLVELVDENLLPQNRVYRYNYVKDNCATRPLSIIEQAMGDSIRLALVDFDTRSYTASFRDVMRHYHRNYPWYQFGIDLALGSGIDYPISNREYAFAPVLLEQQMTEATAGGNKIVKGTEVIVGDDSWDCVDSATPFFLTPMFVGWVVFALLLWATVCDNRRGRVSRWIDATYFGVLGLAGLLITFLVFISVHEATSPNYLIIWLNPFCLIPTIFIWLKKCKIVVLSYQIINFAAVLILCLVWLWLPQSANAAFLPFVLGDMLRSASYIKLNFPKVANHGK